MAFFDMLIYTPLKEEFESLQHKFPPERDLDSEKYAGYVGRSIDGKSVAVIVGFDWGNDIACDIVREFLTTNTCKVAVCIGIGGSLSKDAKLGDVFYSTEIIDLTQRLKQEKSKDGSSRIKYDPQFFHSSSTIAKALQRSMLSTEVTSPYREWKRACEMVNTGRLAGFNTLKLGHPNAHFASPEAEGGKIASTNMVLADSRAVEDVKECGRKMACVDTESAGFAKACEEVEGLPYIVIRGISDTADESKKIAEDEFKNVFRAIAAGNATLFLRSNFGRIIDAATPAADPGDASASKIDPNTQAILNNEAAIREELSRRSIIFKTVEDENKMPVPRLRKESTSGEGKENQKRPPEQEIEEVLKGSRRILVELPKHYPDNALPWLFAHLLTESGLHGAYTVPVIVKWSEFGPPRNSLDVQLEEISLLHAKNNSSYHIVFIFLDLKVGSLTKAQFLSKEAETFRNASYLIFPDRNDTGVYENEIDRVFQPETFRVEGISFSSITKYVQSNFGMSLDESEVVATRLIQTFNNYKLKVHPTYLASIQKDTVLSFIEANQRGELIELAVAGLLTLLVADDKSNVVLRRGTRERFLSKLAVNIYSEKISYTKAELEKYVSEYAKLKGFDIIPHEFIAAFVDNGIIAFENGRAEIAVPVIRTYMLAKGLVAEGKPGLSYFNLDDTTLDASTLDLYSEFSDSQELYDLVNLKLDESITYFENKIEKYEKPVLNGRYSSHLLHKTLDLPTVVDEISKTVTELVEATNLMDEKQVQLDIRAEIAQSKTAKKVDISDPSSFQQEHIAINRYVAGAVILGSAAERMNDSYKLDIIRKLLKLAGLVCTDLLTIYSVFDVASAVQDVMGQVKAGGEVKFDDDEAEAKYEKLVELVVGEWEFQHAANPLCVLLSILCETGRTNVLLSPIMRTKVDGHLEEFFRSTWAFDMDPIGKKSLPKDLSKKLGFSPFLRMIFGIFAVNRIYWYHHGKPKKAAMSAGIDEIFKPLSMKSGVDLNGNGA